LADYPAIAFLQKPLDRGARRAIERALAPRPARLVVEDDAQIAE
jgi:hypothetical protein